MRLILLGDHKYGDPPAQLKLVAQHLALESVFQRRRSRDAYERHRRHLLLQGGQGHQGHGQVAVIRSLGAGRTAGARYRYIGIWVNSIGVHVMSA